MALDFSQKQILNKPLHAHKPSKRVRRLQIYAVLTGFLSMLVSLATLIIWIVK